MKPRLPRRLKKRLKRETEERASWLYVLNRALGIETLQGGLVSVRGAVMPAMSVTTEESK